MGIYNILSQSNRFIKQTTQNLKITKLYYNVNEAAKKMIPFMRVQADNNIQQLDYSYLILFYVSNDKLYKVLFNNGLYMSKIYTIEDVCIDFILNENTEYNIILNYLKHLKKYIAVINSNKNRYFIICQDYYHRTKNILPPPFTSMYVYPDDLYQSNHLVWENNIFIINHNIYFRPLVGQNCTIELLKNELVLLSYDNLNIYLQYHGRKKMNSVEFKVFKDAIAFNMTQIKKNIFFENLFPTIKNITYEYKKEIDFSDFNNLVRYDYIYNNDSNTINIIYYVFCSVIKSKSKDLLYWFKSSSTDLEQKRVLNKDCDLVYNELIDKFERFKTNNPNNDLCIYTTEKVTIDVPKPLLMKYIDAYRTAYAEWYRYKYAQDRFSLIYSKDNEYYYFSINELHYIYNDKHGFIRDDCVNKSISVIPSFVKDNNLEQIRFDNLSKKMKNLLYTVTGGNINTLKLLARLFANIASSVKLTNYLTIICANEKTLEFIETIIEKCFRTTNKILEQKQIDLNNIHSPYAYLNLLNTQSRNILANIIFRLDAQYGTTYNMKRIFNGTNIHFSIDGVAYDFKNTIQHILMTTDMSIPSRSKGKYSFNSINLMPMEDEQLADFELSLEDIEWFKTVFTSYGMWLFRKDISNTENSKKIQRLVQDAPKVTKNEQMNEDDIMKEFAKTFLTKSVGNRIKNADIKETYITYVQAKYGLSPTAPNRIANKVANLNEYTIKRNRINKDIWGNDIDDNVQCFEDVSFNIEKYQIELEKYTRGKEKVKENANSKKEFYDIFEEMNDIARPITNLLYKGIF